MTLFTEKSLNLMPSQALTGLSNALIVDKSAKEVKLATANAKIAKLDGTSVLRTPVSGRVSVGGGGTPSAAKQQESMAAPAQSTANSASLLNNPTGNPAGAPVFVPGTVPASTTSQDVDDMSAEVNSYYESTGSTPSPITATQISNAQIAVAGLLIEVKELTTTINLISNILVKRAAGELPNPRLNFSALDVGNLPPSTLEKITTAMDNNERFIQKQIIAPFVENRRVLAALQAQASGSLADVNPTFDLDFGPPISTDSRFVLSRDGLYYNSRGGTVPSLTPQPVSSTMWNLQYPSNLGGRGLSFTTQDAENTADTIFDLGEHLAAEDPRVIAYTKYDDVLQQFKDDKMSHMMEVSGYITEILANGYTDDDSLVLSYMSQLGAVAAVYDSKIEKRLRQITIAAVYGRESFMVTDRHHPLGEGLFFKYEPPTGKAFEYMLQYKDLPAHLKSSTFFTLEGGQTVLYDTKTRQVVKSEIPSNVLAKVGKWVEIPRIPINDFSYLKQSDVPLFAQQNITLFSEDLNTVIAPYQAHYVVAPTDVPSMSTDSLAVDPIGLGGWVHRQTSGSLSATTPLYKSLTDDIVTDGLLICYNFLDPDAVTQPSGTLYALNNAAEGSNRLDGKLVGFNKVMVFPSGVGQMFCGGTLFNTHASQSPLWDEVIGSYVRLPNTTKDYATLSPNVPFRGSKPLDNLFYSREGVSLDFWAYVPGVHSEMTDEHRYRLVFANENSGPVPSNYIAASTQSNSSQGNGLTPGGTNMNRTIGMIMGWRDRGSPPKSSTVGYGSSGLEFCIAPTVGQNQAYATTPETGWGHSVCIAERWDASAGITPKHKAITQVGLFVPPSVLTSKGFGIEDVNTGYHHINISFNYLENKVDFTFDGELLVTSSLPDVIGGHGTDTVFPTSVKIDLAGSRDHIFYNDPTVESFLGNTVYDERCTPERVAFPVFTPWIIGGGYSDNMPKIPGTNFKPQGFLGSNTNNTWQRNQKGGDLSSIRIPDTAAGGNYPIGQHQPPLSASKGGSGHRVTPRSGLDGYLGSFKIYSRPLNTAEAKSNYDTQKGFFHNILLPNS